MNAYLCANRHHFRSAEPRCPMPNCTAEIRPTAVDPLHGRAPEFNKLQRLPGAAAAPSSTDPNVTFRMSGSAVTIVREGNWPQEQPEGWATILASPSRKIGKGTSYTVTLDRKLAADLADYLASVADVNTVGEGRDSNVAYTANEATERIQEALR